ncbi:MAG: TetR/AcrR family transcriptional regulator [candidate division Zixibacteria bacterium]|nr:TetR/AcrR family transcriptional regulator [candidate division Zixibacteria bacterium]
MSRKAVERESRLAYVRNAARTLFAEKGIENTSMEDIARAVEYTRRTLYAYFAGRDEICTQVFIDDLAARWSAQRDALAGTDCESGLGKILVWGRSLYAYSKQHPDSLRMHFYFDLKGIDPGRISEQTFTRFQKLNTELAEGLRDIFHEGVSDGSLRPDLDVDMSISQFLYSLRSILNRALSPGYSFASFDPDHYVEHFLEIFTRAIRHTGGRCK